MEKYKDEYNIFLVKDNMEQKLNIGTCHVLYGLIVDWFDRIDDQFGDYTFYKEADEETIARMFFIFYGHGLYKITKGSEVIYSKLM